jgi:hypothetical protein
MIAWRVRSPLAFWGLAIKLTVVHLIPNVKGVTTQAADVVSGFGRTG